MNESSEQNCEQLLRRGERFLAFGETDAAKDEFTKALNLNEDNAKAWYLLGLAHRDSKNPEQARKCLKEAIASDPEWLEPLAVLGTLEFSLGNDRQAVKTLKQYLALGGSDIDTLMTLARAAFEVDDCRIVLKATSKIIEQQDELSQVWVMRGLCQAKLKRFNAACTSLNVAVELHPGFVSALNTVGDLSFKAGNYPVAIELYTSSLQQGADQPDVLFRLGASYWFVGDWAEAIHPFEKYVKLVPDDPKGWNNLGVVLREKGEVKRAMECYTKALALDESLEVVRKNMDTAKDMELLI